MKTSLRFIPAIFLLLGLYATATRADILYVSNNGANTIEEFNSSGVGSVFTSGVTGPVGLAFDSAGNLFVANRANNTIERFTSGGVGTVFASGTGVSTPAGLAFDRAGNLYADDSTRNVYKFTTGGVGSVFASDPDDTGVLSAPQYLAFTNDAGVPLSPIPNAVPEPSTMASGAIGLAGLGILFLRRRSIPKV